MTRVLVVDDCAVTRTLLRNILSMEDCAVAEADSAEQALTVLAGTPVDVLVTDVFLGGRNGLWLTAEAKAKGLVRQVVVMSGGGTLGGHDVLSAAVVAGADQVLRKPLNVAAVVEAVSALDNTAPQASLFVG